MTATNHVLAGAIIGASIQAPIVALPLALGSHLILDVLPHFGSRDHTSKAFLTVLGVDAVLASSIFIWLAFSQPENWQLIFIAGFVAFIPDILWLKFWLADMKAVERPKHSKLERFLKGIQWGEFKWGLVVEVPFALTGLYVLANTLNF
jgi:hypothetical protein